MLGASLLQPIAVLAQTDAPMPAPQSRDAGDAELRQRRHRGRVARHRRDARPPAFVVDPRVKGTITLYSEQPLPPREAYLNYLAALRGLGFTVVESGGLLKVVPEADAKLQTGTVSIGDVSTRAATRSSRRSSASGTRTRTTWSRCCAR